MNLLWLCYGCYNLEIYWIAGGCSRLLSAVPLLIWRSAPGNMRIRRDDTMMGAIVFPLSKSYMKIEKSLAYVRNMQWLLRFDNKKKLCNVLHSWCHYLDW